MDGQLGYDGENSVVPRLMDGFNELGSPSSLEEVSEPKNRVPSKVIIKREASRPSSCSRSCLRPLSFFVSGRSAC